MADQVYLSLWLRDYNESNMLQYWSRVIEAFPASAEAPGVRSIAVYPFDWSGTPVFERDFAGDTTAEDAASLAAEFLHEDYAYEVVMFWDLWLPDSAAEDGWSRMPAQVAIACMGPQFQGGDGEEQVQIQINFGLDAPFLPVDEDDVDGMDDLDADPELIELRSRANLQQLVEFVHLLDQTLPITKRLLWCESGENLAEKILREGIGDE